MKELKKWDDMQDTLDWDKRDELRFVFWQPDAANADPLVGRHPHIQCREVWRMHGLQCLKIKYEKNWVRKLKAKLHRFDLTLGDLGASVQVLSAKGTLIEPPSSEAELRNVKKAHFPLTINGRAVCEIDRNKRMMHSFGGLGVRISMNELTAWGQKDPRGILYGTFVVKGLVTVPFRNEDLELLETLCLLVEKKLGNSAKLRLRFVAGFIVNLIHLLLGNLENRRQYFGSLVGEEIVECVSSGEESKKRRRKEKEP